MSENSVLHAQGVPVEGDADVVSPVRGPSKNPCENKTPPTS